MRIRRGWLRLIVANAAVVGTAVGGAAAGRAQAESPAGQATLANWGGAAPGAGEIIPGQPATGTTAEVPLNEVPLGPGVVGIVAVPPGDPLLTETAARIQLELGATATPSRFITCAHADAQETEACGSAARPLESGTAGGSGPTAAPSPLANETMVLSLSRRSRAVIIEAVANLANGTKVFRLVHVSIGKDGVDSTVLSIRAVELLRDVRLEVARDKRVPAPPVAPAPAPSKAATGVEPARAAAPGAPVATKEDSPPAPAADPNPLVLASEAPPSPAPIRWAISAAVSSLIGSGARGYAPVISVQAFRGAHLSADVTAAGPYFQRLSAHTVGGSIDTRQEFATLGARWSWDLRWIRPYFGLAAGLYHLRLGYMPPDPPQGAGDLTESFWAPLALPRAGLTVPVAAHVALTLEYGLLFTGPPVEIAIVPEVLGRLGGPSTLLQLAVAATLP